MDDKQATNYKRQVELGNKLGSIMGHPEWMTVRKLIEDERILHSNAAKNMEFRHDPSQYGNIVRALDNADAVNAILNKFDTIIRLGQEAREKLAKDGTNI